MTDSMSDVKMALRMNIERALKMMDERIEEKNKAEDDFHECDKNCTTCILIMRMCKMFEVDLPADQEKDMNMTISELKKKKQEAEEVFKRAVCKAEEAYDCYRKAKDEYDRELSDEEAKDGTIRGMEVKRDGKWVPIRIPTD